MQIIIKGRQTQVTPRLRQRIEQKLQRLERFVNNDARVEVTVTEEQTRSAKDHFSVQIALSGEGSPIRSEVSALNASTALDLVLDKVVAQLGRHKDRVTRNRRHQGAAVKVLSLARSGELFPLSDTEDEGTAVNPSDAQGVVADEENERIWSRVMEIHRLPTEPMTDQEVIALMQESGASFYPFFNEETNSINVMYKLEEGGFGLLIPAVQQPLRGKSKR